MKKSFNLLVFVLVILLTFQLNLTAFADDMQQYVDKVNHFTIPYPGDWQVNEKDPDYKVQFSNTEGTVSMGVMVQNLPVKTPAKTFLDLMEKGMNAKNELDEKDRPVSKSDLKVFGADDGTEGRYTIVTDNVKVNQSIVVLMKNRNAYILVETIWSQQPDYDKFTGILNDMTSYFKIK